MGLKAEAIEELVVKLAVENRDWGYRVAGALRNLGHRVSHQTMANILKRQGIAPAPQRGKSLSWREFIRSHLVDLALMPEEVFVTDGYPEHTLGK